MPLKKEPLVSVVIPIYNAEKTIIPTIESVLNQSYNNTEIILVDDCSTDSTITLIQPYVKNSQDKKFLSTSKIQSPKKESWGLKNKKFKLIKNKKNSGPAISRNNGIKAAKGEYVFFTDSDCIVPKNWIPTILKQYTNDKIAGVGGFLAPGSNNIIAQLEKLQNKYILKIPNKKITGGKDTPMGYTNNVSYKTAILKKVNGFDESFPHPAGEDIDLKKRIVELGYKVTYIPLGVKHIEPYTARYLFSRIYTRATDKKAPKSTFILILLCTIGSPIILIGILKKLIRYKRQGVL